MGASAVLRTRQRVAIGILSLIPAVSSAGTLPLCADVAVSDPAPTVDSTCAAPDLVPVVATLCVDDCAGPLVAVHVPIGNAGAAAAGSFDVSLVRRDGDGDVVVHQETVAGLPSGGGLVVGPVQLDLATWSTGTLLAVIDSTDTVVECDESDNLAVVGSWPDPVFDEDEDGFTARSCGGDDCDDDDPTVHPGGIDIAGDGIDQDCSGGDASRICDLDGDGFEAPTCGGTDCNDGDPAFHPDAEDIAGDGIDQNCDGAEFCEQDAFIQGSSCSSAPTPAGALLLLGGLFSLVGRRRDSW